MLSDNVRIRSQDQRFSADESGSVVYRNYIFVRVVAKSRAFQGVDFRYCIFDSSYLRDCTFVDCDFTGCHFISTSFTGSKFSGCKFAYVNFEKTVIADDILDEESPVFENQRAKFARTLRVNYQQLGESASVNKAIRIELQATKIHLYEAWRSEKSYYRAKYLGIKRVEYFFRWVWFSLLDFVWGNGESTSKLLRSVVIVFCLMAIYDVLRLHDPYDLRSYWMGLRSVPEEFMFAKSLPRYASWYITSVATARLLFFAAFTSVLIKRYNRR